MTSLVLSRSRPDDRRGGSWLRNWQNIRALSRLGPVDVASIGVSATVTPIAGVRDWAAFPAARATRRWLWEPRAFPGADHLRSPAVVRWIRKQVARCDYDVVVVEGLVLAEFMTDFHALGCRVVFDAHNVESTLCAENLPATSDVGSWLRRLKDVAVRRRIEAVEQRAVTTADLVWTCSAHDAREIRRRFQPSAPVTVVPNGVNVEAYRRAGYVDPWGTGADDWSRGPITLVYPGLFSYGPNEDAALRLVDTVLPAIRSRGYQARAILAGRDPTAAMRERAGRNPAIEITGAVDSIVPILHQPCVVTLPIAVGSGTRLKIIEAFAAGCPVVSTAKGAEGLEIRDGEHLLIREDPASMAAAVIELWDAPERRQRLCANAYALACHRYSWSAAVEAISASLGRLRRTPAGAPMAAAEGHS